MKKSVQTIIDNAKLFLQAFVWCAIMAASLILTAECDTYVQLLALIVPSSIYGFLTMPMVADIINKRKK